MYKTKFINLKSVIVFAVLAFATAAFAISALFVQSNAQEQNGPSGNIATETNGYTIDVDFSYQQGYVTSTRQNLPYVEEGDTFGVIENRIFLSNNQFIAQPAPGYAFVGWYLNGQKLEDQRYPLTSDVVFYAKFSSEDVKLEFNVSSDSPSGCRVSDYELTVPCGIRYTVSQYTITFVKEKERYTIRAVIDDMKKVQIDYWLIDGVKLNYGDTGIINEGHVFTAHFSYITVTEVTGTVKDSAGSVCPNATVCSIIDDSKKIDNIVHTDTEGKFRLAVLNAPKESVNLYAANENGSGQKEISQTQWEADIVISNSSNFNILSGVVTGHGVSGNENPPLAQADVMFQFSEDTSTYLYTTTNANGEYAFIIPNQDHDSGVLVCNPARYIIDGSKITGMKGHAGLFVNNYEMWQGENIQIRYFPPGFFDLDYYETKLEISNDDNKVEFTAQIKQDLNISLPSGDSNVNVDGEVITLDSDFVNPESGTNHVKYQVIPHYYEWEQLTAWKCNGVIFDNYTDFTLTESLDFEPIVTKLITISGLVCNSAEENNPQAGGPLEGVTVAFLNDEDFVISETTSTDASDTNFTLTKVPVGSSGNILFIKDGKEPSQFEIKQEQTQENLNISKTPAYLKDGNEGDRYIIGRITDSASTPDNPIPVAGARISFTYGDNNENYINAVSNADGSYLVKIQDSEPHFGYFGVVAYGYKSLFKDYFELNSQSLVTPWNQPLEKFNSENFCDIKFTKFSKVQKFQFSISKNQSNYKKAVFDISSDFSISVDTNTYKIDNNENVLHVQDNAEPPQKNDFYISTIPNDLYKVASWNIDPQPSTTISQNTVCSPNLVLKSSEVVLNAGPGVNGFNYKYYINDKQIWDKDIDVVEDTSYLNTEITVDEFGVVRSKLIIDSQAQNEADIQTSVVTPYVDENYEFESLIVNDEELAPGDSIIVKEDMTYNAQLNFKYVEPPAPPTPPDPPTPSDPGTGSQIVNAQTGDFNWFTIAGLAFAFAVIAFTLFASRKQTY